MLAELRKRQGMTQQDLAQKLHVKQNTVSTWETGVSVPRGQMLLRLARILHVTTDEILQNWGKEVKGDDNSGTRGNF